MGTDLARYGGGAGDLIVADQSDLALHSSRAVPGHTHELQRQARSVTDAEYLEAFEQTVGDAFEEAGFRDPGLVGKTVAAARHVSDQAGNWRLKLELPAVAAEFGKHLVEGGVRDVRHLSAAMAVGFQFLRAIENAHDEERDESDREKGIALLREKWGSHYRRHVATARNFINSQMPPSLADAIWTARDVDGRLLANSADVISFIARLALGTTSNASGSSRQMLEQERREIEHTMKNERRKYDGNAQMRMRYLEILELLGP
jgi:hypothetical protein